MIRVVRKWILIRILPSTSSYFWLLLTFIFEDWCKCTRVPSKSNKQKNLPGLTRVADSHHFYADPDPYFYYNADPLRHFYFMRIQIQLPLNNADPYGSRHGTLGCGSGSGSQLDPDLIRSADPGGQKWPTKVEKIEENSCFEVPDQFQMNTDPQPCSASNSTKLKEKNNKIGGEFGVFIPYSGKRLLH